MLTSSTAVGNTALAFTRTWRHADAEGEILGRLATQIAIVLMGKHKPIYDPATDCGDFVVVTNAQKVLVTGNKATQKLYRSHSGYPGGLKEVPFNRMLATKPDEVIRRAVSGMLPKNRLRDKRLARLHVFPGEEHPYEANIMKDHRTTFGQTWSTAKITARNPRNKPTSPPLAR